jgi:hypothetical protein
MPAVLTQAAYLELELNLSEVFCRLADRHFGNSVSLIGDPV